MKSGGGGRDLGCGKSKRRSAVIGFDMCLRGNSFFFSLTSPSLAIYIQYLVPLTKHPRQDKFVYALRLHSSPPPPSLVIWVLSLSLLCTYEGAEGSRVRMCVSVVTAGMFAELQTTLEVCET